MDVSPLNLRSSCDRRNKKNIVLRRNISGLSGYPFNMAIPGGEGRVRPPKIRGYRFVACALRGQSLKGNYVVGIDVRTPIYSSVWRDFQEISWDIPSARGSQRHFVRAYINLAVHMGRTSF